MPKQIMTAQEFIAHAEKRGLQLKAIVKEVPKGSGRKMLFGFEFNKASRHYRKKFLLNAPVDLDQLKNGPIKRAAESADTPATTGAGITLPAPGAGCGESSPVESRS